MIEGGAAFQDIEHIAIPLSDGITLSARVWLPKEADSQPVPAIFEIIPYRKSDMVRPRDERNHPFFAAQGYASLRVDMRGSGDSEGQMADMYCPEELTDTREVIDWIATQAWCNGSVGMFGTSWGGTASLQAASKAPPALKAVIAVCATHDRYEDDIHHMGGLLLTDSIEWGATLPAILALPPAEAALGQNDDALWKDRLEQLAFPLESWVREEERSSYWQWGSVIHQTETLSCPILAVGGWSDRYSNSVMTLLEARPDLVWGIVGPWSHHYPDAGHPGPAMAFQVEALAWWDHWLRDDGRQAEGLPRLRSWLCAFDHPQDALDERAGSWVEVDGPPSSKTADKVFYLGNGLLFEQAGQTDYQVEIPSDLRTGQAAGDTGYFGRFGGLPLDQQIDDNRSLVFETAPLTEPLDLFGITRFEGSFTASHPLGQVVLRLSDVSPDGRVNRVALAVRNLALDDDFKTGAPLKKDRPKSVVIAFHSKAYKFKQGHRLRLALSSSYWPIVWPSPSNTRITLATATAALRMPLLRSTPKAPTQAFEGPIDQSEALTHRTLTAPRIERKQGQDDDGAMITSWHQPFSSWHCETTKTTFGYETTARHRILPGDPKSAESRYDHRLLRDSPEGRSEVISWASVTCDANTFFLRGETVVIWNGEEIARKNWSPQIRRRWG